MAISSYSISLSANSRLDYNVVNQWFEDNEFQLIQFKNNKSNAIIEAGYYSSATVIYHKIKKKENFKTYYKEDFGGSLLVFEIRVSNAKFECIGYSPITLFGFYRIKVSFKEKSGVLAKYRQHGYKNLKALKKFIAAYTNIA